MLCSAKNCTALVIFGRILERCNIFTGIVKRSSAKQNGCSGQMLLPRGSDLPFFDGWPCCQQKEGFPWNAVAQIHKKKSLTFTHAQKRTKMDTNEDGKHGI